MDIEKLYVIWLKQKYNDIGKLINAIDNGDNVYRHEDIYFKLFKEFDSCMKEL